MHAWLQNIVSDIMSALHYTDYSFGDCNNPVAGNQHSTSSIARSIITFAHSHYWLKFEYDH